MQPRANWSTASTSIFLVWVSFFFYSLLLLGAVLLALISLPEVASAITSVSVVKVGVLNCYYYYL
jgi:hypothetical protein